jgi:hypothetical protein
MRALWALGCLAILTACFESSTGPSLSTAWAFSQPAALGESVSPLRSRTDGTLTMAHVRNEQLFLYDCAQTSCASGENRLLDSAEVVNVAPALVLLPGNVPAVLYQRKGFYSWSSAELYLYRCQDALCSQGTRVKIFDSLSVGTYSLETGSNGHPTFSFGTFRTESLTSGLFVVRCESADCSTRTRRQIMGLDATGTDYGTFGAVMALAPDGNPLLSHYTWPTADQVMIKCDDPTCSTYTRTEIDHDEANGHAAIAFGADDLPIVVYYGRGMKILNCGNAACSGKNSIVHVDGSTASGNYNAITFAPDGKPVISYLHIVARPSKPDERQLRVLKCGNAKCSSKNRIAVLDTASSLRGGTSIVSSSDGSLIIGYGKGEKREMATCSRNCY